MKRRFTIGIRFPGNSDGLNSLDLIPMNYPILLVKCPSLVLYMRSMVTRDGFVCSGTIPASKMDLELVIALEIDLMPGGGYLTGYGSSIWNLLLLFLCSISPGIYRD